MNRLIALTLVCVSLATAYPVSGQGKERQWQTGTLLDIRRDRTDPGNSGSTTTAVYHTIYVIDAGDHIYECQARTRFKLPASATLDGPIQFAIDRDRIYIKSKDGSERETTIIQDLQKLRVKHQPSNGV